MELNQVLGMLTANKRQLEEITNIIDDLENGGVDAEAREDITKINELLGDDELETEAQTVTGAINVLNDELNTHKADTVTDADGVHGFKIEYGTFTPTLSNGTTEVSAYDVANTAGYYRKLKDVVFFDLSIKVTTIGDVTGGLRVGGFPFATDSATFYAQTSITELENLNFGTDMIGFELFWDTSRLMRSRSASTLSEVAFSDISDGFYIRASGQYRAAS